MPRAGLSAARLARTGAEVADELGLDAVTPTELARRHGVRVASLYTHVSGARELRVAVTRLALAELRDRLETSAGDLTGLPALRAIGDAYREYAREHPGRWAATRVRLTAEEAAGTVGRDHADLARRALEPYRLDEVQQVHAIRLLGATWSGFIDLETAGSLDHSEPPAQASWDLVPVALDALLQAWSPADPATT